ncbi:MAG: TldD/PmbA family protein [Eubacteriales bacterium]|nr:TldD/PmbA family protein [Eubacteriales bacterium]
MYQFPANFYSDVRIEDVTNTTIKFENGKLRQRKVRTQKGAFLRLYDGKRWYYASVTDLASVQSELNALAAMARPNEDILRDPVVRRFQVNRDEVLRYQEKDLRRVPAAEKQAMVEHYAKLFEGVREIATCFAGYVDTHSERWFYSSLGADIHYDYQHAGLAMGYTLKVGNAPTSGYDRKFSLDFEGLKGHEDYFRKELASSLDYAKNAVPVEPGTYTCVLAPVVTGVFAHESFGHKSESDFMLGSETMRKEWAIGTRVGSDSLNILDSGIPEGSGYVPYDDEGTRATKTYLVKNGILAGRLHSAATAAALDEAVTGNARAKDFEFEPIVRMTTTYIGGGEDTLEDLLAGAEGGIYISDLSYGTGMSTFTIAPSRAYRIRGGKIAEPVRVSVISGNVMETLHKIDGATKDVELCHSAFGGCGKMEQGPLRVSDGGSYIRVRDITVQ